MAPIVGFDFTFADPDCALGSSPGKMLHEDEKIHQAPVGGEVAQALSSYLASRCGLDATTLAAGKIRLPSLGGPVTV